MTTLRKSTFVFAMVIVAVTTHAQAAPHNELAPDRPLAANQFRDGANHHLGDDSFVATFNRLPTADDSEALRMHTHLVYVRSLLAHRAATEPKLAVQRQQLLGELGDYIAAGITPHNRHVDHRSPVFIDDEGAICAVGYLIERSVGRQLPELIASKYRYDFLETIAAAMPEVAAWVAQSGLTLDELAALLKVSKPTVWSWERGKSRPTPERIPALAERLGVTEDELVSGRDVSALAEALIPRDDPQGRCRRLPDSILDLRPQPYGL